MGTMLTDDILTTPAGRIQSHPAYFEGRKAHREGQTLSANPHKLLKDRRAWQAFVQGWYDRGHEVAAARRIREFDEDADCGVITAQGGNLK